MKNKHKGVNGVKNELLSYNGATIRHLPNNMRDGLYGVQGMHDFYIDMVPAQLSAHVEKALDEDKPGTVRRCQSPYKDWEKSHRNYLELTLTEGDLAYLYRCLPDKLKQPKRGIPIAEVRSNNIDLIFRKFGRISSPCPREPSMTPYGINEYTPYGLSFAQWKAECDKMAKVKQAEIKERKPNRRLPNVPMQSSDIDNEMDY